VEVIIKIIYNIIITPLSFLIANILALFNPQIRGPLYARFSVLKRLKKFQNKSKKTVLIHAASMGEFEHIKPLITKIKKHYNPAIIVSFFSPSGYENVKDYPGVDLFLYTPFDTPGQWTKFYSMQKPDILIIAKHDAWPNQIWMAAKHHIPIFLINAALTDISTRLNFLAKIFYSHIYKYFETIHCISDEDKKNFEKSYGLKNVVKTGDTKFDQVIERKTQAKNKELINYGWLKKSMILLFGSIWPEDAEHIIPAIKKLIPEFTNLKIILVPHETTANFIASLVQNLGKDQCILFSELDQGLNKRVLIVNKIGILADLYKYAKIAYVGGSFKQGVHNIMEAAVYGIPVLYGPEHINATEAESLLKEEGSLQITNSTELVIALDTLLKDDEYRKTMGLKAEKFVLDNTNTTKKLIKKWEEYLS